MRLLSLAVGLVVLVAACTSAPDADMPQHRFRVTSEEAGFLAKGELFEIYGPEADPVVVDVIATRSTFNDQVAWRLDTLVEVVIDGGIEEQHWRFWVGLGDEGRPTVLEAEEHAPQGP